MHYFTAPEPGKMYAKLNWRVSRPNGQFYERSDIQTFEQDPNAPGILYNHDNEFLHYQDDWYIAAFDPNDYMFVYYRGSNDAWDGYGGAVIYSRTPQLNPAAEPVLRETAERARPLCVWKPSRHEPPFVHLPGLRVHVWRLKPERHGSGDAAVGGVYTSFGVARKHTIFHAVEPIYR